MVSGWLIKRAVIGILESPAIALKSGAGLLTRLLLHCPALWCNVSNGRPNKRLILKERCLQTLAHNPKVVSSNPAPATKHIKGLPLGNPFFISGVCQFCVNGVHHPWLRKFVGVVGEVIGREVSITPHHLARLPATQFLKDVRRGADLHMPAGPGVAQVVPAKICDADPRQRGSPGLGAGLAHRATAEGEYPLRVLPFLLA